MKPWIMLAPVALVIVACGDPATFSTKGTRRPSFVVLDPQFQ